MKHNKCTCICICCPFPKHQDSGRKAEPHWAAPRIGNKSQVRLEVEQSRPKFDAFNHGPQVVQPQSTVIKRGKQCCTAHQHAIEREKYRTCNAISLSTCNFSLLLSVSLSFSSDRSLSLSATLSKKNTNVEHGQQETTNSCSLCNPILPWQGSNRVHKWLSHQIVITL